MIKYIKLISYNGYESLKVLINCNSVKSYVEIKNEKAERTETLITFSRHSGENGKRDYNGNYTSLGETFSTFQYLARVKLEVIEEFLQSNEIILDLTK